MDKELSKGFEIPETELFKSQLVNLEYQIKNRFPDFDLKKNNLLIKDYLILRNAISSKNLNVSEEIGMFELFDKRHVGVFDDDKTNIVLRFITEVTATPEVK
jgi:hypothetical protein